MTADQVRYLSGEEAAKIDKQNGKGKGKKNALAFFQTRLNEQ